MRRLTRYELRQVAAVICVIGGLVAGFFATARWAGMIIMLFTGFTLGALIYGQILQELHESSHRLRRSHERLFKAYQRMILLNRSLVCIQDSAPANDGATVQRPVVH